MANINNVDKNKFNVENIKTAQDVLAKGLFPPIIPLGNNIVESIPFDLEDVTENVGNVINDVGNKVGDVIGTAGNFIDDVGKAITNIFGYNDEFWEGTRSEYIDKDGNKLENAYYVQNSDGTYTLKCEGISYKDGNVWKSRGESLEVKYDKDKRKTERILYDQNGKKKEHISYTYSDGNDASGNAYTDVNKVITKYDKDGIESFDSSEKERVYGDGSKKLMENSYKEEGYGATINFTFDENGDRKSVSVIDRDGNSHIGKWEQSGEELNIQYDDGNRSVKFENVGNNKITFKVETFKDDGGNVVNEKSYYDYYGVEKLSTNTDYRADGSVVQMSYNLQQQPEKQIITYPSGDVLKVERTLSTSGSNTGEVINEINYYSNGKALVNGKEYNASDINQNLYK